MKQHYSIAQGRLLKNKIYAIINIGGLMIGAVVTLIIGFWIAEEISIKPVTKNNHIITNANQPSNQSTKQQNFAEELRISFGNNFELLVLSTKNEKELLTTIDKKICCKEITTLTIKN